MHDSPAVDQAVGNAATHELVVDAKEAIAEDIVSLRLRRADGGRLPDWTPGAHIDLVLANGLSRQYSLCGDPADATEYRVAVLHEREGAGGSAYIHNDLHPGDRVGLGGPRNNFALVPAASYTFVAGGIGITPILPMMRAAEQLGADWRLLYLGRERGTMAFVEEFEDGRVTVHPAADRGRAALADWIGTFEPDTKLYACGPARLLNAVTDIGATWRPGWVRIERFTERTYASPSRTSPFDVEVAGTGTVVRVRPDVSVASALRQAGVDILTSCSRGVCGTCETAIVAGEPDHRDSILDETEQAAADCFFPCVSRARSDRLVIAL